MKITVLSFVALLLVLSSCAPVYKCGDPVPQKISGSKRLKAVVKERDQLCASLNATEKQRTALTEDTTDLGNKVRELQAKYESAASTSESRAGEISSKDAQLREREKALQELQRVVARQDSITKRLNDILRNALLGFNSDELSVEIINGKVYVSMTDKLLFKSGSAAVETKGKDALKLLADVLNKNPDINILIEGHTDSVPIKTIQYKDNWDLSVARATSIVRILTLENAVSPARVTASGRGEFFPKAPNTTAEGRARNRRTEIILSPKLDEVMKLLNTK